MSLGTEDVLEPLSNNVIVRQFEADEKSPGGLILPVQTKKARQPKEGTVIAAGPGKLMESGTRIPMPVEKGDRIIFAHHAGQIILVDDEELLLMTSEDVLAKINRDMEVDDWLADDEEEDKMEEEDVPAVDSRRLVRGGMVTCPDSGDEVEAAD